MTDQTPRTEAGEAAFFDILAASRDTIDRTVLRTTIRAIEAEAAAQARADERKVFDDRAYQDGFDEGYETARAQALDEVRQRISALDLIDGPRSMDEYVEAVRAILAARRDEG